MLSGMWNVCLGVHVHVLRLRQPSLTQLRQRQRQRQTKVEAARKIGLELSGARADRAYIRVYCLWLVLDSSDSSLVMKSEANLSL